MYEIKIFEGHNVEVIEVNGNILFNPYNVGECLGLTDSAVRMSMSKMNGKQVVKLTNSDVNNLDIRKLNNAGENFLTESGVYKLVFKSHKDNAERFQDWVTDEVLPSIRKTGSYQIAPNHETMKESVRVGEVASLVRVVRSVMKDQKSSPEKIAFTTKTICDQCGINLPENFVEENPFNGQLFLIGFGA